MTVLRNLLTGAQVNSLKSGSWASDTDLSMPPAQTLRTSIQYNNTAVGFRAYLAHRKNAP